MNRAVVALLGGALALLMFGCASSKPGGGACDPVQETCACDASTPCPSGYVCDDGTGACVVDVDAGAGVDAPTDAMLKGFGVPCLDKTECQSNICIFVGASGGRCTSLCGGGDCPSDWGCFGVVDVVEQGTVTEVCVPVVDQLCSSCTTDNECVQFGADRCLAYPDGKRFCGRDCRTIGCPSGYTCQDRSMGGEVIRQCVPTSGACDCDASSTGMAEACTIMTPFNTACGGTRTCQGATGWGPCAPPSTTDDPDGGYVDANCDGIDGDVTRGIFVAGAGANTPTCGLTSSTPCQTIGYGIVRAATTSRTNVFVQTGTYNEVVVLVNGINVWGGYSFAWQRGPYSNPAHRVTITGGADTAAGGDGEYLAVRAHDLIVPVTIGDLVIDAPDAVGAVGGNGRSSYGVHVDSATVRLERVQITGGNGAAGPRGSDGTDAVIITRQSYMDGTTGGDGREYSTACDSSGRGAGGARGTNTCSQSPSGRDMDGGGGGDGGTMDSSCVAGQCAVGGNCSARAGGNGGDADYRSGGLGEKGYGSTQTDGACAPSSDPHGNDGAVINGGGGSRQTGGLVNNGYWYGRGGTAGGTGENGGGGGGGGGGAGCDDGEDAYGAGGGGGGAGGCAARSGGGGGGGGGGSFGVFVASGSATLATCTITRGIGGVGGAGGNGGRGQDPGVGAGPGQSPGSADPGTGGAGGHGGHAGGGGGGQGGRAVGIGWLPGATVTQDCAISGGMGGAGGSGGPHAPTAPVRDGNDGQTGLGGTLDPTRQCASATDC